jgi:hypothetical protein
MGVAEFWGDMSGIVIASTVAAVGAGIAVGFVRGLLGGMFRRG